MKYITAALIIAAVLLSCDLLLQEDTPASYPDEMSHAMRTALKFLEVDVSGSDDQIMQSLQEHINTDLTDIKQNDNGSLVITGTHEEGVETYRAEVDSDENRIVFWRLFTNTDAPKPAYFECQEDDIDLLNDYRYMEFTYTEYDDPDINGTFTMTLVDIWKAEEFSLNVGTEDEESYENYENYVDAWIYRGEGTVYADGRVKLNNGSEHSKHVPRVWIDETWSPAEDEYVFKLEDEPAEDFSFSWNLDSLKEFIEAIDTEDNFSSPDGYPYIAVKMPHNFPPVPDDFYLVGNSNQGLKNDGYHTYVGHAEVCGTSLILFLWGNKNNHSSLDSPVYPYELKDVVSNADEEGWWVSEFEAGDDFFDDYEISLDDVD